VRAASATCRCAIVDNEGASASDKLIDEAILSQKKEENRCALNARKYRAARPFVIPLTRLAAHFA
jgi:hypothetical protein